MDRFAGQLLKRTNIFLSVRYDIRDEKIKIPETRFWNKFGQTEFNQRQIKAINRLLDSGPGGFEGGMKNRKYSSITHTSRATAQRELSDLVNKGALHKNPGGGRSVSYDLVLLES